MHLNTHVALLLVAGTLSSAMPAPQAGPSITTTLADGATTTLPAAGSSNTAVAYDQLEQLASFAEEAARIELETASKKRSTGCTPAKLVIRREWSTLSGADRKAYTAAVKCLLQKKNKTPSSFSSGARHRFDDFVASHINQTMFIHYTGTFLAWHRYYTWQYEQTLRNECGYKGAQPYWDWAKTAATGLERSALFDGSDTSMSGNGLPVPNQGDIILAGTPDLPQLSLPPGSGGGPVTKGPFANMQVNLGPVSLSLPGGATGNNGDGLSYNPRPLKRDLTDAINRKYANATSIINTILKHKDIDSFQMTLQGIPGTGDIGIHGGGHYSIGGDPGRDFFTSPGDPVFYMHHAMIDRVWWIWQALNAKVAYGAKGIAGTGTFLNSPPSPNTTLNTVIDLNYATAEGAPGPKKMSELLSTVDGPFCYIYL